MKSKYITRRQIQDKVPQLRGGSFTYWMLVAGVKPARQRKVSNRLTFFFTPGQARRIVSTIKARKPELFSAERAA